MDGTTEPLIAVIGHPIAGNPTQFAIERALDAMQLDWRVMSFDVKPEDLATALDGFAVTGIDGVMIDASVARPAAQWLAGTVEDIPEQDPDQLFDCLYRDQDLVFQGSNEQQRWIDALLVEHGGEKRIWIGDSLRGLPVSGDQFPAASQPSPPDPDAIAAANVVLIADTGDGPVCLDVDDWPSDDGSTLVIDLTEGHPDTAAIAELGYQVITPLQRRVGTLRHCLQRWTGQQPSAEVIHDAIEEYLGV